VLGACCHFDDGSCTQASPACCKQDGGQYLGPATTCTPGDICRPACENCSPKTTTFYECAHYTSNPAEPCDQTHCIEDAMMTASCDSFPDRIGPPACNTFNTGVPGQVVQTLYLLPIPQSCNASNSGGFHLWTTTAHGCGAVCDVLTHFVRCDAPTACAGGIPIATNKIDMVHACGCP